MARGRAVAAVLLLASLGCLSAACGSVRTIQADARSRMNLERMARERPARVEAAETAWEARNLEVRPDSLSFLAPAPVGGERRIAVPLHEVRDLSIRNPERGAGRGALLGMLVGFQIGLWIDLARDAEGDYYDGAGGASATGLVVGGMAGFAAGSRWGGWTHYRLLRQEEPPGPPPGSDSR